MFVSNASSVDIIIYLYFVVNMNKWQDRSTYCISPYRFVSSIRKVWIYQICVTRSRKSQDRQYNDLQNTTQKIEERATRTLIKTGGELKSSERVSSSCTVMWHSSCCSCYKSGDKSWMRKLPDCDLGKRNIPVVIWDTDVP